MIKKKDRIAFIALLFLFILMIYFVVSQYNFNHGSGEITSRTVLVKEIPVVETYLDDGKQRPMIIVQHGFKNKKEATDELAKKLAGKGFFVIAPDAYAHGQRGESPASLVEIIVNTSKEYDSLIEAYSKDRRTDITKLGITGFSMGGCITFYYAVYGEHHPEAIAPVISTPDFEQLIGSRLSRSIYSSAQGVVIAEDENTITAIDQYIIKNSPFKDYKNLKDVAILMQNGELDDYVTSDGVYRLEHVLSDINPKVQLLMIPETKHQVTGEMTDNIVAFMEQNVY